MLSAALARVLLVEDNDDVRSFMRSMLERKSYEVLEAGDGEAAIQIAMQEHPDVIVMDLGLPVLNGVEASRILRQHPATASIPILAVSAHGDVAEWRERALGAGCFECLVKPVHPTQVLSLLNLQLSQVPAGN